MQAGSVAVRGNRLDQARSGLCPEPAKGLCPLDPQEEGTAFGIHPGLCSNEHQTEAGPVLGRYHMKGVAL
jgi:hypothetical protein